MYTQTLKHYSSIKRSELLTYCNMDRPHEHYAKWKEAKISYNVWFHLYETTKKVDWCLPADVGEKRVAWKWTWRTFLGDGSMLNWIVGMVVQLCKFTNNHWTVRWNWMNFLVCNLCLSKVVKQREDKIKTIFNRESTWESIYCISELLEMLKNILSTEGK